MQYKKKMTGGIGCDFHAQTKRWYDSAAKWLREDTLREGLREHCGVLGQTAAARGLGPSSKGKSVVR